jgi:hypothetical protein
MIFCVKTRYELDWQTPLLFTQMPYSTCLLPKFINESFTYRFAPCLISWISGALFLQSALFDASNPLPLQSRCSWPRVWWCLRSIPSISCWYTNDYDAKWLPTGWRVPMWFFPPNFIAFWVNILHSFDWEA